MVRMMYKVLLIGLVFLLLNGCASLSWTTAGKIIPPFRSVCPLQGKWMVIQNFQTGENSGGGTFNRVGDSAQFTRAVAMLGSYVWNNPTYKIKEVNSTDYLMTKYINLSGSLMLGSKNVDVITVSAEDNFLGEFMRIDDSKLIAFVQNSAFYLQKVSDQVDSNLATFSPSGFGIEQGTPRVSGVLVGLKVPSESNSPGSKNDFTYQTLWLAADGKKLRPILVGDNIFFPRNSGFWKLQVNREQNGAKTEDVLAAHDVATKIPAKQAAVMGSERKAVNQENLVKIIDYVGNDYVAIENDAADFDHLQVLPVDKISSSGGIKLSDLIGSNGLAAYNTARAQAFRFLKDKDITLIDEDKFEENFGLIRKNGHWYLQGRVNYLNGDNPHYLDYSVNLIPPAKLIYYDTLSLSWQNIKDRIPEAVDAFTSPNRDLALVLTKSKLYVYGISSDLLDSEPLAKIDIKMGETVVMAEWATGSYVDNWEKAFLSNGAKVLDH